MDLGELTQEVEAIDTDPSWRGVRICDLTEDSRTVLPGSLFVAKRGTRVDGRGFIDEAVRAGAVAVLTDESAEMGDVGVPVVRVRDLPIATALIAERFFGNASRRLALCGVTGTNGKSTVAHMVSRLLGAAGMRCGLIGTVTIEDGREVARASMTTPPAIELSRTFATMVESRCVAASLEVSSHALAQGRTDALSFDAAVFTNLTGDHLDYHKTVENYRAAKARLFAGLRHGATAVINVDDPASAAMVEGCRARIVRCGAEGSGAACTWWAGPPTLEGTPARFTGPWGLIETRLGVLGDFNALNALLSLVAASSMGADMARLTRALPGLRTPAGRLERVGHGCGDLPAVFVDYAHTDDALANALRVVRGLADGLGGRVIVVFGCGGERDRTKRPRMGAAARRGADLVFVTSDNPRSERPSGIIDDILGGIPADQRTGVEVHVDRDAAIRGAIDAGGARDVVLIAGKGHENEQVLPDASGGTRTVAFDDVERARAALDGRARVSAGAS